jgi:hypothetical protein
LSRGAAEESAITKRVMCTASGGKIPNLSGGTRAIYCSTQ